MSAYDQRFANRILDGLRSHFRKEIFADIINYMVLY